VVVFESKRLLIGEERDLVHASLDLENLGGLQKHIETTLSSLEKTYINNTTVVPYQSKEAFFRLLPECMELFSANVPIAEAAADGQLRRSEIIDRVQSISAWVLAHL